MKKNSAFFSLLCLFSMGVAPMAKATPTQCCFSQAVSKVKAGLTFVRGSLSAHPYRTLGVVGGVSLLGYIMYLYRTGALSCDDVKGWITKLYPCTKKTVDAKK